MKEKPSFGEYPDYYRGYVELVPEGEIIEILSSQLEETISLLKANKEKRDFRYAEGKWSLIEVVGHIIDTERVMAYRLLRIARGDKTSLHGYDDEVYVENAHFSARKLEDLLDEFILVRKATLVLLKGLPKEVWQNIGYANNGEFTVNSIAYIIAGH
ncbi:MAG TPA: DinB family protein, partial [Niallia sp.]|nr:DinB family protein [Niallia sp.]